MKPIKILSFSLLIVFEIIFSNCYAQQMDATFSIVGGSKLQMVLNQDATFQFSENYSNSQNAFSVIVKNVYNSVPSPGGFSAATGLSYNSSAGKSGNGTNMGTYGGTFGPFNHNTDEVIAFSLAVGTTIVSGETITIMAGTVIQTSGNYSASQTFNAGPYTSVIANSAFSGIAATMVASSSSPTITTTLASSIANTSATLAGNVTDDGGEAVTERGVVYAITALNNNPEIGGANVTKDTNGNGNGTFSETISGLNAGTQYSFKAYAINSVGTSYGSTQTFTTTGKGWTGAVSTNWSTAGNWSPNSIPIASDNLVISNVTNQPIINGTTGAVANDIEILSGASLTINSGGSLIVSGTATGNVTYNRAIDFVSNDLLKGWYLLSSPVVGQIYNDTYVNANDIGENNTNNAIATYSTAAASNNWDYHQNGETALFTSGVGYAIKRETTTSGNGTIPFTGTLNTNNSGVSVTLSQLGNRFNLVGNPYTSYINSAYFLDGGNAQDAIGDTKTIWVFNQTLGTNGQYEVKVATDNFIIAPAQGFFVQADVSGTNTFTFDETNQTHSSDTFQKSNTMTSIKVWISDGVIKTYNRIRYLNDATLGFDVGKEGELFGGVANSFSIYSHLLNNNVGKKYQLQSLPNINFENMIIPLGLKVDAGKEITFSVEALNIPSGIEVYLEDRLTDTFTKINNTDKNYQVTFNEKVDGIGRFYLHTKSKSLNINNFDLQNVSIYKTSKSNLKITGLGNYKTKLYIFNSLGKQVFRSSFLGQTTITNVVIPKLTLGMYIVKLQTIKGVTTKKIIID